MLLDSLPVTTPFPWPHLLRYLQQRVIPGVESIDGDCYVRRIGKRSVTIGFEAAAAALIISADGRVKTAEVLDRAAALFDIRHDSHAVTELLRRSAQLQDRVSAVPGMRPPAAWSPFELCVRTVLGQQVSVAGAGTLMRRLVERCGEITPECVIAADLTNMGMPGKRVETIRNLAHAVQDGRIDLGQPWAGLDAALKQQSGFGPWTRSYLAIRLGRDADAFPETDVGLIRAAQVDSSTELLKLAEQWRPYRGIAATYLWSG